MAAPTIAALPSAPTRSDPANFNTEAEAFSAALATLRSDINAFGTYLNTASTIVGGLLDATIIGSVTPAAGTFTSITGSDDLSIDGGTLFVDASTNRVGVGTTAPEQALSVNGSIAFSGGYRQMQNTGDANGLGLLGGSATTTGASMALYGGSHATQPGNVYLTYGGAGPTIGNLIFRFHNGTGFSEAARIDSAGNVGIGVTAPTNKLEIFNAGNTSSIQATNVHGTLTADVARLKASRAASTAYNFLTAYSGGLADLKAKLDGTGTLTVDGTVTGGGADVAEFYLHADGNPLAEDRRGISVVLVGDKIREAVAGENPFGVISSRPTMTMNAESLKWAGKYLRDDFDCDILEDYEVVSWVETVTETVTETEQATEVQEDTETVVTIIDGAAVQTTVTKTREVPLFDEYPLTDATGNDLGIHREPRMVEVTRETTKEVEHSYAADEVPVGITVPVDAARVTQQRQKLNPDYVTGTDYVPRQDRPEWASVGVLGRIRVRTGQVTGAGWTKLRDVSADVEEWLVR